MSNHPPEIKRSRVTTHVLDATLGRPAAGVSVRLEALRGEVWEELAAARTDSDGRIAEFGPVDLDPGSYRVWFDVAAYFADTGQTGFYPEVTIAFSLDDPSQHYHVPLLLSPYAYSTYRGS
jgi:5-hydroxyisourate hydrolase